MHAVQFCDITAVGCGVLLFLAVASAFFAVGGCRSEVAFEVGEEDEVSLDDDCELFELFVVEVVLFLADSITLQGFGLELAPQFVLLQLAGTHLHGQFLSYFKLFVVERGEGFYRILQLLIFRQYLLH